MLLSLVIALLLSLFIIHYAFAESHALSTLEYLTLSHMDPKDLTPAQRGEMVLYEMGIRDSPLLDLPTTSHSHMSNDTISINVNQTHVKSLDGTDVTSVTRGNRSSLP